MSRHINALRAASELSTRPGPIAEQYVAWAEALEHPDTAMSALLAVSETSKDPERVMVNARQVYEAAVADGASDEGDGQAAAELILEHLTAVDPHGDRAYTDEAIDALIDSAPGTMDTLREISLEVAENETALGALVAAMNARLVKASNLADLPDPAAARVNLGLGDVGDRLSELEAAPVPSQIFRGPWSASQKIGEISFDALADTAALSAPLYTKTLAGSGTIDLSTKAEAAQPGGPAVTKAVRLRSNKVFAGHSALLNVNLAASGFTGITGFRAHWAGGNPTGSGLGQTARKSQVRVDGSVVAESLNTHPFGWSTVEGVASANSVLGFFVEGTYGENWTNETGTYVGLIEILGSATPYMAGQTVTHLGQLWTSKVDNNGATPGSDVTKWSPALIAQDTVVTVPASGAAQTVPETNVASISRITLTANCTLTFPTAVAGRAFSLVLIQDATGSRTVAWPASVKWPGGTAPTLTATAGKRDVLTFICVDGTNWLGSLAGANYS